ncbi:hypothetical protein BGZ99_009029 [Dissophora globulifera]|uniref:C2H2-type domain-containing protein n=1 Tax=Dissophora globulifera TaxID=979702 RepID=A0A9P6UNY6_9FUNG|nr:hypothetical protein BGZ99_009029 [Dissophora globulifera]
MEDSVMTAVNGLFTATETNGYSFPNDDLTAISWSFLPSKNQLQQVVDTIAGVDYDPDLSPAMSICTPAGNGLKSPFAFDALGLDELSSSPSVGWQSPLDDVFENQQSQESFDYDFDVDMPQDAIWSAQTDFQLFPDANAQSVTTLQQLLMAPLSADCEMLDIKESPFESDLCYFSALDSSATASPSMCAPPDNFGESSTVSSSCHSPVYRPPRRHRRLRVTSEDESRVIPEQTEDDPNPRPRYKCSVCEKTFSRPFNLRSHRTTHAGVKPFECEHVNEGGEVCGWAFARRHDLERHTKSRHSAEKQFRCANCGTECGRTDAFKRHFQRHPACAWAAE